MPLRIPVDNLVFQIEVTLKESKPPIWRRFQVPSTMTLAQFHDALQIIMGWTDSHLHRFIVNGKEYGRPDHEKRFADDDPLRDEHRVRLASLFPVVPASLLYEYDYGDGWQHVLVVEQYWSASPDVQYPVCVEGERACPPEDVGGIHGYEELLAVLADPKHEENEGMRMWAGEDIEPEAFDVETVNQSLRHHFIAAELNDISFTTKQGQYLAFIHDYTQTKGRAPAEADIQRFFGTTPPTVHQMILRLDSLGLISRIPGQARSIRVLVPPQSLPALVKP
jgi:hypothetical protein